MSHLITNNMYNVVHSVLHSVQLLGGRAVERYEIWTLRRKIRTKMLHINTCKIINNLLISELIVTIFDNISNWFLKTNCVFWNFLLKVWTLWKYLNAIEEKWTKTLLERYEIERYKVERYGRLSVLTFQTFFCSISKYIY